MRKNALSLAFLAISFAVLIPGLTRDLITLRAAVEVPIVGEFEIMNDTRSIVSTVRGLYEDGNHLVATLILLFSIVVPFIKGALLLAVFGLKPSRARDAVFRFVKSISKWAMCDVFVVGVYVAFLSAKASEGLDATIHDGFYWFTAYCLTSLLALQFMRLPGPEKPPAPETA